jgi:ribosome-associated protein
MTMQDIDFTPVGDSIELHQLLKATGVCDSGGAGKALVASGAVSVDGRQELRKSAKIRAGQCVNTGHVCIRVLAGPDSTKPPPD